MDDDIKAIRDALAAGPVAGPWQGATYRDHDGPPECDDYAVQATPSATPRAWETLLTMDWSDAPPRGNRFSRAEAAVTRDYIAACHPERIARLLDALEQAQAALAAERERAAQLAEKLQDAQDFISELQ